VVKYSISDIRQTATGAFLASLFFLGIRAGEPLNINPIIGGIIILYIIWLSNPKPLHENLDVLLFDVLITYIVVAFMALTFELATIDMLTFGISSGTFPNFAIFGSAVAVAFWIALPVAVIYNKKNIENQLSRVFIQKR